MSSDSSPLVSRRRSANIPSDQKSLLEGQDSWAVDLRNQPRGLAHIPDYILEAAKTAHLAQKKTPQSKKRSATSPIPPASSKRMRNSETPPRSSPEKSIPWSPSPERDQPKQAASKKIAIDTTTQSSIVQETTKAAARPGLRQRQRPPIPTFQNPPSSESEYDMETRIPDAQPLNISINQNAVRSNRTVPSPLSTNKPMATPPCAQPSNPTQSGQDATDPNRRAERSKSRLSFKKIFVDDSDRTKRNYPEKERLKPTIMPPVIISSKPTSSSESFIPSTYNVPATQESIRESIEVKERDNRVEVTIPSTADQEIVEKTPSRRPVSAIKPKPFPGAKSAAHQDKPALEQVRQQLVQEQQVQQPTTPTPIGPPLIAPGAPREPFETFVQHYPEYASDSGRVAAGTKLDFITACIYLNYLRSRKRLRDCLYDEFIRAFPRYYKEYVDKTQKRGMEASVAIEWFNEQKEPQVFNKFLVNSGNLSHILRMYPNEFEVIEKMLQNKKANEIIVYTSSEDEGESSEEQKIASPEIASPVSVRPDKKAPEEPSPPVASLESQTDKTFSEIFPAVVSNPPKTTLPVQPESSWAQDFITQAPPPPSPKIPGESMPPPSSIPDPVRRRDEITGTSIQNPTPRRRDPRPISYFEKLASRSRASSSSSAGVTSTMDDDRRREKLKKYWRKSKSNESPKSGAKTQGGRSSSGRAESRR
ncbi:hypothetical protein FPOAC2_00346 [Fusarium poae]|uniref:hypothetical protein n=1 Tax=Fusarium poae TaxID=36050 RepID=UPI001CE99C98|nr:hypothetical protein FPOAC1_000300 [Fusarium poae]KAG8674333.1 hypothetical protein FPOAC1_000300 [Fusarium poae]